MPGPHHLHWGAEALWQRLEPLLPGLSVEVLARAESTNTLLLERARAMSGQPDAPITRPGDLSAAAPDARTPLVRIDFQFLPIRWAHGLRVAETVISEITDHASDHRPLLVEWMWPGRAPALA